VLMIIGVLSGVSGFFFLWGIYLILTDKRRNILKRIGKYTQSHTGLQHDDYQKKRGKINSKNMLLFAGKIFASRSFTKKIEEELAKAGVPLRGEEFIVINITTFLVGAVVGLSLRGLGAGIVFGAIGLIGPFLFMKRKKRKRLEKINQEIGDCLTVMTNSLRAGYSLQQTMDLVSNEMNGPLAVEFRKTIREINFGTPTEKALTNLAAHVESEDVELMITAVLIQRQIGGNLAEILDNISHTIRERIRIKGEIKTLTAQGRISGLIIGLMPPAIFAILLVINPTYIRVLFESKTGFFVMLGGVVSELFGVLVIKKIVNIEV